MCSLRVEDGTVVAAHYQGAQSGRLGKGMGIKPPDYFVADLCRRCHDQTDRRDGSCTRDKLEMDHQMAVDVMVTIQRRIDAGLIKVT